jgi:hypothetical protein
VNDCQEERKGRKSGRAFYVLPTSTGRSICSSVARETERCERWPHSIATSLGIGERSANLGDQLSDLRRLILGLPGVDQVGADARAASLSTRSIKASSKLWAIDLAVRMVDLTTLEGADTPGKVMSLCAKARRPDPTDDAVPPVAAVCVYPDLAAVAKQATADEKRISAELIVQPAAFRALETWSRYLISVRKRAPFWPGGTSSASSGSISCAPASMASASASRLASGCVASTTPR